MQFALIGLLTAIIALKRPYLTLDLWVRRSAYEIGLSPAMWADDRLNVGLLNRGRFFPRFNQFGHASIAKRIFIGFPPDPTRIDCMYRGSVMQTPANLFDFILKTVIGAAQATQNREISP